MELKEALEVLQELVKTMTDTEIHTEAMAVITKKVEERRICSWSAEDVKAHFENMKKDEMSTNILPDELTEDQISNILDYIEKRFDAEYGVTWNTVEWAIEVELDVSGNE